jgi:ribosome-associated protein
LCFSKGNLHRLDITSLWYNTARYIRGVRLLDTIEIARKAVTAASEKQASDIVLLDVREVCSFASYFVICSGESERQISAIHDEIEQTLKKEGIRAHHREGTLDSGWMLLDFGDIIVHIFAPAERAFYRLDELWSQAVLVVRIQ